MPDGSLDPTFSTDGKVTTDFAGGFDEAFAVALQPDGKIVAAGGAVVGSSPFDFALTRYNPDGSLDPTFGTDGKATTDFGGTDEALAMALQPDGKIVAAGQAFTGSSPDFAVDFAVARYNPDGSLDSTFGTGGKVTTDFAGFDAARAVALQPNGKIVAAGGSSFDFAVARYKKHGSLDPSFGPGGKVTTDFASSTDVARAVALQPDGKIVAAGDAATGTSFDFALARYLVA